jgi:hypothetical protein
MPCDAADREPSGVLVARAWAESGALRIRITASVDPVDRNATPSNAFTVVVDSYDGFLAVIRDWLGRLGADGRVRPR